MQEPRQRRGQREGHQQRAEGHAVFHRADDERAQHAHADQRHHPAHAEHEREREPRAIAGDHAEQHADQLGPAHAFGPDDRVRRLGLGGHGCLHLDRDRLGLDPRRGKQGALARLILGLRGHQSMVRAAEAHELRVPAGLHHAPGLEGENPVGADHAREPVREDQGRPAFHEPVERFLDHRLTLGIHRGERFVQDEDGGIAQEGARDRDPLALAAGEPDAALAHDRLVALRQPRDELLRIGGAGGRRELGRRGARLAHTEVLRDRAVEEIGVLAHHRDEAAELIEGEVAQVVAADHDAPPLRVVEAEEEPGDGGLARAARPHDADALPRLDLEGEIVVSGVATAGIGERHALEGHGGRERRRVEQRPPGVSDQGLGLEDLDDAARGGDAEHPLVEDHAQLAEGAEDLDAQHQDDEKRAQAHLSRLHPPGAETQRRRRAHRHARVRDAAGECIRAEHTHGAVEKGMAFLFQQTPPRAALTEGLESGQALDGVEELRAEGGIGLLARETLPAVLPVPDGRRHERHQRGREQHERDRQIHEGDEGEDERRGEGGHGELRQVLAEIDLELLHALHH